MGKATTFSPEVWERAVRLVREQTKDSQSQWATNCSVEDEIGRTTETLRQWLRKAERDAGIREAFTSVEREELKRENTELRQANEILKLASAYFAKAELDRQQK